MGFFDMLNSFADSVKDSRLSQAEKNYEEMNITQLQDQWKNRFGGWASSFTETDLNNISQRYELKMGIRSIRDCYEGWKDYGDEALVLDRIYGKRTGKKTILALCDQYESLINQVEQAEQEHENNLTKFKELLAQNDMISEIVQKINDLGYDADSIGLEYNRITCQTNGKGTVFSLVFKKYGYPDLSYELIEILSDYLVKTLALKFIVSGKVISDDGSYGIKLALDDAPGGMKAAWI